MADNNYSGNGISYGDHTQYTSGNASTSYGEDTEYFNNGDTGVRFGEVVYFTQSGGHAVDSGGVTYYYDKNGNETGKCIHNGNNHAFYGDCGPCTADSSDK